MRIIKTCVLMLGVLACFSSLNASQIDVDTISLVKNNFASDFAKHATAKSVKKNVKSVSTNVYTYQYTTDGYLQLVAVYQDSVICTNLEGPRTGAQFIIMNNGALVDMCNFSSTHSNYILHSYVWGYVKTYKTHQVVTVK